MNIYTQDGWLDMDTIYKIAVPFIFITGARGIGKTYGGIDYLYTNKIPFMLLRRTQSQASMESNPLTSDVSKPLKAHDEMLTFESAKLSKTVDGLYLKYGEDEKANLPFCYTTSVSTGSNLRGFNGDAIDCILFDEFIAQPEERPIKEEANALLNLYETINRNREIQGREAVKLIALANSFNLANPIFIKLGLVQIAEKMRKKGKEIHIDKDRGFCIIQPMASPISEAKKETALYKLVGDNSDFAQMAIGNKYLDDFSENIKNMNLLEYKLIATIPSCGIYKHKSNGTYYVSMHVQGTAKDSFTDSKSDLARFKKSYFYLWIAFLKRKVYFESYLAQVLFDKMYK